MLINEWDDFEMELTASLGYVVQQQTYKINICDGTIAELGFFT